MIFNTFLINRRFLYKDALQRRSGLPWAHFLFFSRIMSRGFSKRTIMIKTTLKKIIKKTIHDDNLILRRRRDTHAKRIVAMVIAKPLGTSRN